MKTAKEYFEENVDLMYGWTKEEFAEEYANYKVRESVELIKTLRDIYLVNNVNEILKKLKE